MTTSPQMAALIHNDGMEPTIPLGSIAVARYPSLSVERWQVVAYRSQLTLEQAVYIAMRDSGRFSAMSSDEVGNFYAAHYEAFGALRINRVGRVVGLPGESIELSSGGVIINGEVVGAPETIAPLYRDISDEIVRTFAPVQIPDHQIYILQDNLIKGNDSRTLGTVKLTSVLGSMHDLLLPEEVSAFVAGRRTDRVPSDLLVDLEEQHGPASSWARPN